MNKTFEILKKEYGLKNSSITILATIWKSHCPIDVRQIVKETKIPIGTIYDLLKELVDQKLINITKNKVKLYSFSPQNIELFLENEIKNETIKREKILSSIKEKEFAFQAFDDYEKFRLYCYINDRQPKTVWGVINDNRFPIFFYPKDKYNEIKKKQGHKQSNIYKNNYSQIQENCKEFKWILSKQEIEEYFKFVKKEYGIKTLDKIKNNIKNELKKNTKIKIIEQKKDYTYFITNKTVQFRINSEPVFVGMVITDNKVINYYKKMFENLWNEAKIIKI